MSQFHWNLMLWLGIVIGRTSGGDPVPDTDSRSLFHFPHHCGIGDFTRFFSISHTVTADFHVTWQNIDTHKQDTLHVISNQSSHFRAHHKLPKSVDVRQSYSNYKVGNSLRNSTCYQMSHLETSRWRIMPYSQVDILYRCNEECNGFLVTCTPDVITIHLDK